MKWRKSWDYDRDWFPRAVKRYGAFASAEAAYPALLPHARRSPRQKRAHITVGGRPNTIRFARVLMAYDVGRTLRSQEHVHHRDGNRENDHPSNLQLYGTQAEHKLEHGCFGLSTDGRHVWMWDSERKRHVSMARRVMQIFRGRKLREDQVLWHRNGNRWDNRPSNLEVLDREELGSRLGRIYGRQGGKARHARHGGQAGAHSRFAA